MGGHDLELQYFTQTFMIRVSLLRMPESLCKQWPALFQLNEEGRISYTNQPLYHCPSTLVLNEWGLALQYGDDRRVSTHCTRIHHVIMSLVTNAHSEDSFVFRLNV